MINNPTYEELEQKVNELERQLSHPSSGNPDTSAHDVPQSSTMKTDSDEQFDLQSIIDIPSIQSLMDDFYDLTNIGIAILDLNGKVLAAKGWQDICVKFHRVHPETSKNCMESDLALSNGIEPGTFRLYRCKNNMLDMATPITLGSHKIGNLYLGQFLFDDEPVNEETFRLQSRKFGFEEDQYIEALEKVPRWSKQTVDTVMRFYTKFAQLISELGYENMTLKQNVSEKGGLLDRLKENENKYRELVENLNDVIYAVSNDGKISYVSPSVESVLGYSHDELIGRKFNELVHEDDLPMVYEAFQNILQKKLKPSEYRIRHKNNEFRWVRTSSRPVYRNGRVVGLQGVLRDIADRKESDAEIARLKERLAVATDSAGIGVWELDLVTDTLVWDEWMYRLYGIDPGRFGGAYKTWKNGVHPDDLPKADNEVQQAIQGVKPFDTQFRIVRPDGEIRHLKAFARILRNSDGVPVKMIGVNFDITGQKRNENALRDSEEKYRVTFESITDSITVTRVTDGLYLYVNDGFSSQTGYSREEVLGRTPSDINLYANPGERERFIGILEKDGKAENVVVSFRRKGGEVYDSEFSAKPISYAGEDCLLAQSRDITDRRRAENAVKESEKKYRTLVDSMKDWVWSINGKGEHTFTNGAVLKLLGYTPEEILNRSIYGPLHPESATAMETILAESIKQKKGWNSIELKRRHKDGSIRIFESTSHPDFDETDELVGWSGIDRDITRRKHLEEQVKHQLTALTQPEITLDNLSLTDVLEIETLQRFQDAFSEAFMMPSIIYDPEGKPLTTPSGFTPFCQLIRSTRKGSDACEHFDKKLIELLRKDPHTHVRTGCVVTKMVTGTVPITIQGKHLANWGIGQMMDGRPDTDEIRQLAKNFGVEEDELINAAKELKEFDRPVFERAVNFLKILSEQVNLLGLRNLQQGREISARLVSEKALKESEIFLENITDIAYSADNSGNIVWVNSAIEKITGLPKSDIIGKPFLPLFMEEDHASLMDVYNRTLQGESLENTLTFITGVTCDFTSLPRRDHEGKIVGTFGIARDITEKLSSQEALRESEDRLKRAQRVAKIGSWEYDIKTEKVWGSEEAFHIYGIERKSPFLPLDEVENHILESERVDQALVDLITQNEPYDMEFQIKPANRPGLTAIHSIAELICDIHGNPLKVLGVIQDITEQKQMREVLKQSEEKYRAIFENKGSASGIFGEDGVILECNAIFEELSGYDKAEIVDNMKWSDFVVPEDLERLRSYDAKRSKIGESPPPQYECRITNKAGEIITVIVNINLVGSHRIVTLTDITAWKYAEKERENLQAQLLQAQKMESIGTLAGGIAHDFNNILSSILGYSELALLDLPRESPMRNKLEAVYTSGTKARELVAQILAFSRKDEQVKSLIELHLAVEDALKLLRHAIPSTIHIQTEIDSNCRMMGDPSRINQVVMNLCTNAYQAMLETGGTLHISLSRTKMAGKASKLARIPDGLYGKLVVADTGVGIPEKQLVRIFEPYFTTKEKGKGTGLGLAVVHGIIKSHKGAIRVESKLGKGTRFEVYLPLTWAENVESRQTAKNIARGSERILLVDDQEDVLQIETEMLEMLGYDITGMTRAREALEHFAEHSDQYDLVITDMTMPDMTGDKLAEQLREIRSNMPIILATGYSELISREKAQSMGIDGFLTKPVQLSKIATMIRKVIDGNPY